MSRKIILCLVACSGAYIVGRVTTSTPTKTERIVERGGEQTIVRERLVNIDLDAVRSIVRDELANAAPPEVLPTPPPIDEARLAEATSAVDVGLADARWTVEDRDRLRTILRTLPQAEGEQVLAKLIPALNSGRIKVGVDTGPF